MLQRSGEALYSSCAGDNPRTCSATICVVISKCTSRCSRSALVIGSANNGAVNKPIVSVRYNSSKPRSVFLRRMVILVHMVATPGLQHQTAGTIGRKQGTASRRKITHGRTFYRGPGSQKRLTCSLKRKFIAFGDSS